jgi:hypothetical protein
MQQKEEILMRTKNWIVLVGLIVAFFFLEDLLYDSTWETKETGINLSVPTIWVLMIIFLGVIVHELIHGLCFACFAENGHRSVNYRFISLNPSCHCNEPIKRSHFMVVLILPLIILGILPLIGSYYYRIEWIRTFGLLFTVGAFSDLWFFIVLIFKDNRVWVQDHPEKVGFILLEPAE